MIHTSHFRVSCLFWLLISVFCLFTGSMRAQAPSQNLPIPSAATIAEMLAKEPITLDTWPQWRERLVAWIRDRTSNTDEVYSVAYNFILTQADANGELKPALASDYLAWYFLSSAYLFDPSSNSDFKLRYSKAEKAVRQSLKLNPDFAFTHRLLAIIIINQEDSRKPSRNRLEEVALELARARQLDPSLPIKSVSGRLAFLEKRYDHAEKLLMDGQNEQPPNVNLAILQAQAVVMNPDRPGQYSSGIQPLIAQHPDSGMLACIHAVALSRDDDLLGANRELQRARSLGIDTAQTLPADAIKHIESGAKTRWRFNAFIWTMIGFPIFYGVVMLLMAIAGLILAKRNRGSRALRLLQDQPDQLVTEGQVVRVTGETMLAKLYALALTIGLILFYISIPFVFVGLLAVTGLFLFVIFQLPRIPIQLVLLIACVGLGMAWAVLKSIFIRPQSGSFGILKSPTHCPRLHELLADVARRVETDSINAVYLAPGSDISVHQEGSGPFGIFGVKRRVLTLGFATMHFLNLSELQSILAHEYAHFSHSDTFYSRFIYKVQIAISQALDGMGQAGGTINYINPFFWFLFLYYKCYSLLSSGYSRSREFLADRMACSLYGSDVFESALRKVSTEGALFDMTIHRNIAHLLDNQQAFLNMYEVFREFRDKQMQQQERSDLYKNMLDGKGSLFASHPTFAERMEAIKTLPRSQAADTTSALSLFDQPEELEKELTEFLTQYMMFFRSSQT